MRKIIKGIYNYLINSYGFCMKQYTVDNEFGDNWIAVKEQEQGIECVLVTRALKEYENVNLVLQYLISQGKPFNVKTVVLSNGPYTSVTDSKIHKVIVDINNNLILYTDYDVQGLGNLAIDLNTKEKVRKHPDTLKSITTILIGINIVMFIISIVLSKQFSPYSLVDNAIDIDGRALLVLGAKYGPLISNGQVWRLITCAFLHGGIIHLACNMYSLYIIGPQVEAIYGKVKFLIIYLLSAVGSSLFSFYFSPNTLSIGASGAIFGVFSALLVFVIRNRDKLDKAILTNLIEVLAINLLIGLSSASIDNFGHLGGLVVGAIVSIICSIL